MRLIDAEHLKKRATNAQGDCWDNYGQGTADFLEYIDNEPTVDAIEVVRCKDCKYFYWWVSQGKEEFDCHQFLEVPPITPEWYCAWGERKE